MTADEIRERREELDRQLYAPGEADCTAVYAEYLRLGDPRWLTPSQRQEFRELCPEGDLPWHYAGQRLDQHATLCDELLEEQRIEIETLRTQNGDRHSDGSPIDFSQSEKQGNDGDQPNSGSNVMPGVSDASIKGADESGRGKTDAEKNKRIAELEEIWIQILEAPASPRCRTVRGHDYNHQGVCLRGCGIPKKSYAYELQAEIERLREALEKYADRNHWGDFGKGYADQWQPSDAGYELAEAALKGPTDAQTE